MLANNPRLNPADARELAPYADLSVSGVAAPALTVGDPVNGIVQLAVKEDAGLTFATGLKAMLRLGSAWFDVAEQVKAVHVAASPWVMLAQQRTILESGGLHVDERDPAARMVLRNLGRHPLRRLPQAHELADRCLQDG